MTYFFKGVLKLLFSKGLSILRHLNIKNVFIAYMRINVIFAEDSRNVWKFSAKVHLDYTILYKLAQI